MPLTEPKIDDRTFEQIVSDLRQRIPRYTKEWTNFNDSDPGITLLQLFAWLSEMMLFRMNQVPLKNYVKFLKLLGQDLRPALPAVAALTFVTDANKVAGSVPERTQISAQVDDGGDPLIFETGRGLDLIRPPLDTVGVFDGGAFTNVTAANDTPGTGFRPLGWAPAANNALYLGFVPPDAQAPGEPRLFPAEMTFRVFLPPEATAGQPQEAAGAAVPPSPPVTLAWEYRPKPGEPWERLNVFEDESLAFTREGYIRVEGPLAIQPNIEARLNAAARFWIRVRLDNGSYPAGRAPKIDFLRTNTVDALNLSTVRGEILGVSEGHPQETFQLEHKPVAPDSLRVQTESRNGDTQDWQRVDDFLSSKPDQPHYTLNATAGSIQFGDGDRGLIPDPAAQVIAVEYRYGGGARGNLAVAGKIASPQGVLTGVSKVTNLRPAVGGADEETLDEVKLRAPSLLRQRNRAVTPEDFESIVKAVGGIAASRALPLTHPDHRGVPVAGAITVVIVPDNEDKPPKPSGDLIRQICVILDQKRLLTTEVFVKGPEYQEVRVEARVTADPYASFDKVTLAVIESLDKLLDPRKGQFGKELFPTSLYSAILQVPNLVGVLTLNLYVDGRRVTGLQPVLVPPDGLLFGGDHLVTVEPAKDQ